MSGKIYLDAGDDNGSYLQGPLLSESSSGGIGFGTGAGASVTQLTSRSTGVTINTICGHIKTDDASLAAGAYAIFTVTNSSMGLYDGVLLTVRIGKTTGATGVTINAKSAGSFDILVFNHHASTAETADIDIDFQIIKSVIS